MAVYKTKGFGRFARRQRITDEALCDAIARADGGMVDADLGGGVIKQRVARPGQVRSAGFRTIILYRTKKRSVFIDGFAKSDQDSIDEDDLARFRELASEFLGYDARQVAKLVDTGAWIEVRCNDEDD